VFFEDKVSPLGKRKQELWLADKLGEDSVVKAVQKARKNSIMKISRHEIETSRQIYWPGKCGRGKWQGTE
jgi:hypothetical protein